MAHPMKSACSSDASRVRKVSGYRRGGAVHKTDAKADKKMFAKKFEPKADMKAEGGKPKARLDKFARGGKVKGKGATTVNVIVSPKQDAKPDLPPMAPDMPPPPPPMAKPPMPMPPPGGPMPPPGAGGPPGMPMRKNGGAAYAKGGKVKDDGLKRGTPVMHDDAKSEEQKHFTNKPPITRKRGGRADGGSVASDLWDGFKAGAKDFASDAGKVVSGDTSGASFQNRKALWDKSKGDDKPARKRGGTVGTKDGAGGGLGRMEKIKLQKRA